MIAFLIEKVTGWRLFTLTVLAIGYGGLILAGLPYWSRLEAVQGGTELQERFFYTADQAATALANVAAAARPDAYAFYALDVPNAVFFAMSLGALIGWGLKLHELNGGRLRLLVALPLLSGGLDLFENACLAIALAGAPGDAHPLHGILGTVTGLKLVTGNASIVLMLALVVTGLGRTFWARARR